MNWGSISTKHLFCRIGRKGLKKKQKWNKK